MHVIYLRLGYSICTSNRWPVSYYLCYDINSRMSQVLGILLGEKGGGDYTMLVNPFKKSINFVL